FGRGILDIARAFAPIGATSLPGAVAALPLGDGTGTGSPAMGDALAGAALPAIVLDEYGRAFRADLGTSLRGAEVVPRLNRALGMGSRNVSFGSELTLVAFSIDERGELGTLRLRPDEAETARVLAARVTTQLALDLRLGFAFAESADGLVAQLQGQAEPAFLIAPDASGDAGALRFSDVSFALRKEVGPWGLTFSAEQGRRSVLPRYVTRRKCWGDGSRKMSPLSACPSTAAWARRMRRSASPGWTRNGRCSAPASTMRSASKARSHCSSTRSWDGTSRQDGALGRPSAKA